MTKQKLSLFTIFKVLKILMFDDTYGASQFGWIAFCFPAVKEIEEKGLDILNKQPKWLWLGKQKFLNLLVKENVCIVNDKASNKNLYERNSSPFNWNYYPMPRRAFGNISVQFMYTFLLTNRCFSIIMNLTNYFLLDLMICSAVSQT